MLRVTLDEDFGGPIRLVFGFEVTVPMHFGTVVDPTQMVNFRAPREALPAERRVWPLDWVDEENRSVLMPDEVAVHYFGDMRAEAGDHPDVRARRIPNFNDERIRVAQVWGDYLMSAKHGHYTTVRIAVPRVPVVTVHPVNQNGMAVAGGWSYRPHEFFKFEELLAADAAAEVAELQARRPSYSPAPPSRVDIANLSDSELDALAVALSRRTQKAKVANG